MSAGTRARISYPKRILLGLVLLVGFGLAVPLFNWITGVMALQEVHTMLEERGAPLSIEEVFAPWPNRSTEKTFANDPFVRDALGLAETARAEELKKWLGPLVTSGEGQTSLHKTRYQQDPAAMANALGLPVRGSREEALEDLQAWMAQTDSFASEMSRAAQLAPGRIPLREDFDYTNPNPKPEDLSGPYLHGILNASHVGQARAEIFLALGESRAVVEELRWMQRSAQILDGYPGLITCLIQNVITLKMTSVIWGGLIRSEFSNQDLRELEALLAERTSLESRLAAVFYAESLALAKYPEIILSAGLINSGETLVLRFPGINQHNKANLLRFVNEAIVQELERGEWPNLLTEHLPEQVTSSSNPNWISLRMVVPSWASGLCQMAYGEALVDMARVAIALELHKAEHGIYPKNLEELDVPVTDPMNQQTLGYRLAPEPAQAFRLYSVGWDRVDDLGKTGVGLMGRDEEEGDWIWQGPFPGANDPPPRN